MCPNWGCRASKGFAFLEFAADADPGLLKVIKTAVPTVKVDGVSVTVEYSRGGENRDAAPPQKNSKVASAAIEAAMAMYMTSTSFYLILPARFRPTLLPSCRIL